MSPSRRRAASTDMRARRAIGWTWVAALAACSGGNPEASLEAFAVQICAGEAPLACTPIDCEEVQGCQIGSSCGPTAECAIYGTITSKECDRHPECTRTEECAGTPTPCAELPIGLCDLQPGCSLHWVPR